jgi:hypothetical protein
MQQELGVGDIEGEQPAEPGAEEGDLDPAAPQLAAGEASGNPSVCREIPSSSSNGKKYQPWRATSHFMIRCGAGSPGWATTTSAPDLERTGAGVVVPARMLGGSSPPAHFRL